MKEEIIMGTSRRGLPPEETEKIRVNIFDYEVVDVCGGQRLRRKFTGIRAAYRQHKSEENHYPDKERGLDP